MGPIPLTAAECIEAGGQASSPSVDNFHRGGSDSDFLSWISPLSFEILSPLASGESNVLHLTRDEVPGLRNRPEISSRFPS